MRVLAVIPARLGSTRLPRKPLREIAGEPMIGRVYRAVAESGVLSPADVLVATDSEEILSLCRARGWNAEMTSEHHRSGTERVHEIAQRYPADIYFNIQGDEPLTRAEHVRDLLALMQRPNVRIGTLKTAIGREDLGNPNVVKVVTAADGRALYFSRAIIPYDRDAVAPQYFKHLGLYAYDRESLDRFCSLPESSLEQAERLEQLRFLENGHTIYVAETQYDTVSVDTEDDLRRVQMILSQTHESPYRQK